MAAIILKPGLKWEKLPGTAEHKFISIEDLAIGLMQLRADCQELADYQGVKLADLMIPAGAILADFVDLLQVGPVRKEVILGIELLKALEKRSIY